MAIDQQGAVAEGDPGTRRRPRAVACVYVSDLEEDLAVVLDARKGISGSRQDCEESICHLDLCPSTIRRRAWHASNRSQQFVVDVARKHLSEFGIIDVLPLDQPTTIPGALDAGEELVGDEGLVQPSR